jgi:hypothetical protein
MQNKNTTTKYVDHLNEDEPLTGQKWVCISFLSPEGIKNCSVRGLKIRGVYDLREDADKRAKELQETDPDFHVFVGEVLGIANQIYAPVVLKLSTLIVPVLSPTHFPPSVAIEFISA